MNKSHIAAAEAIRRLKLQYPDDWNRHLQDARTEIGASKTRGRPTLNSFDKLKREHSSGAKRVGD